MDDLSIVVIPARDEQERIGTCVAALGEQTIDTSRFEVILVADGCRDRTEAVAREAARRLGVNLSVLHGAGQGPGPARRLGMDAAADRLEALGLPYALIATTDADTRPAPDWLERQLAHTAQGAQVIAGKIELEPREAAALPTAVRERRTIDAADQLQELRSFDPEAAHHDFGGASIGVTVSAYRRVGGLPLVAELEDEAFAQRVLSGGIAITRPADVRVLTAARTSGRARRGLAVDLAVSSWLERRHRSTYQFDMATLRELKLSTSVSVVVTSRHPITSCDQIRSDLQPLCESGLVDELLIVDSSSGKGDAMWEALRQTLGEIVCYLDADGVVPRTDDVCRLVAPLIVDPSLALVKGSFGSGARSPATTMSTRAQLTELTARPLLNLHFPLLAGFQRPLGSELAARRTLLEELPFPVGHGVEVAVLIDGLRVAGLDALAEVDMVEAGPTEREPTDPEVPADEIAFAIVAAVEQRLDGVRSVTGGHYLHPAERGVLRRVAILERPPIAEARSG